jgi:hypothetical protein
VIQGSVAHQVARQRRRRIPVTVGAARVHLRIVPAEL